MINHLTVRKLLDYNPNTGVVTRKRIPEETRTDKMYNKRFAGSSPTSKDDKGYLLMRLQGKTYRVARLIFLWMTGEFPDQVDHKNRVRDDNRWSNLRELTSQQNSFNRGKYNKGKSSSCYEGVSIHRKSGKWRAQIAINGEKKHLGLFDNEMEAHLVYKTEYEKLTGGIKVDYETNVGS